MGVGGRSRRRGAPVSTSTTLRPAWSRWKPAMRRRIGARPLASARASTRSTISAVSSSAPLNSASAPSPWRKKRSIGAARSMADCSAGGTSACRATSAARAAMSASSARSCARGLRSTWPPSGSSCVSASRRSWRRPRSSLRDIASAAAATMRPASAISRPTPGASRRPTRREMAHLAREAGAKRAARASGPRRRRRGAAEIGDPGDEPCADDIGAPGDGVPAVAAVEPVGGPAAGPRPGGRVAQRGEIGEPGEAVQLRQEGRPQRRRPGRHGRRPRSRRRSGRCRP